MNALFLKDLANKVRRGQRGRAEASRAAGGLSYGYRVLREIGANGEVERGRREIDPEAARIIRRIFEEYVAGRSPRAIAADLNREGVPSPRGGSWNASTINGNPKRRHGILLNTLYAGKMEYGRLSYRRDPDTGSAHPGFCRRTSGFSSMYQSGVLSQRSYGGKHRPCGCATPESHRARLDGRGTC